MKTGSTVRLIQPEIRGRIVARRIKPDTDNIEVLVEFTDASGQPAQRWCDPATLEEVPA